MSHFAPRLLANKKSAYKAAIWSNKSTHKLIAYGYYIMKSINMIELKKEDNLMSNVKNSQPPKTKTKAKSAKEDIKKTTEPKSEKKKFYKDFRFWIVIGIVCVALVILIVFLIINNKRHEEVVSEYSQAWSDYASAQNSFGYEFGAMLGEMGFSTDGSSKYDLSYSDQNDISEQCAKKVGIYNDVYDNPYAIEDKKIAEKSTADIETAVKNLKEYTEKINAAKSSVAGCKEIGEAKKKEIDDEIAKKEAEEKAKAEEEAAKKKQQEEAQAAYQRNKLTYEKFTNQINEGMSLNAVKDVYGWFDSECKISSQSGGYVLYSCSSSSTYDYWAVSFTFYNNVLKSKAQTGLK